MISMLLNIIFPLPPSLFVTAASVTSLVSMANSGFSEFKGKNLQYSQFWRVNPEKSVPNEIKLSGRDGMLLAYMPAFLAGIASFWFFPNEGFRFLLVKSTVTIHFLKRVFEVLFIHNYSGAMPLNIAIPISLSYFTFTSTMMYAQHLTNGFQVPLIDLQYPGIVMFFTGIGGNFYHHYLLSKLRSQDDKEYKVPKGGLFEFVICPHYLFEILGFWGISFISQTSYAFSFTIGSTLYLMGRSWATRRWYLSKFEDFSEDIKALIPFVF